MKLTNLVAVLCVMAVLIAAQAGNNSAGGSRVQVANPVKIFSSLQETKDLIARMDGDRKALDSTRQEKQNALRDLRNQRDVFKPDDPKFEELNRQFVRATIDFDSWVKFNQAELSRVQKQQMLHLYDKITASVAELAQRNNTDVVLAQQRPEIPANLEGVEVDQLRALLGQRNILYASNNSDISDAVIAAMDAKYKTVH